MASVRIGSVAADPRVDARDWRPRNCVWELTLGCRLRCRHCGSSAGRPRPDELTKDECLDIAGQLAALGCEVVTLSGGEPTLRPDWTEVAEALAARGVRVNLVTCGVFGDRERTRAFARAARDAGLRNVGVSVDGTAATHDALRGRGTHAQALATVEELARAGVPAAVMTTVNRLNVDELGEVRAAAMAEGASLWRLQLAKPMGNLRGQDDVVLPPERLRDLLPALARFKRQGGIDVAVGDSLGYYGPHDEVLRGVGWRGGRESWQGCQAGMQAIGIESDGGIKGCLSLQARSGDVDPFVEGNLRHASLEQIWYRPGAFAYNRDFDARSLTGSCARCTMGRVCRGGARCVSSATSPDGPMTMTEDRWCWTAVTQASERRPGRELLRQSAAVAAAALIGLGGLGAAGCRAEPLVAQDLSVRDAADGGIPDGGRDGASDGPSADLGYCAKVCCLCDYGLPPPPECCP